jgi:hypothetical protein
MSPKVLQTHQHVALLAVRHARLSNEVVVATIAVAATTIVVHVHRLRSPVQTVAKKIQSRSSREAIGLYFAATVFNSSAKQRNTV